MESVDLVKFIFKLLSDSKLFLQQSKICSGNEEKEQRLATASILCAWAGFEGWINKTCQDLAKSSRNLLINEIGFLKEKRVEFIKGEFVVGKSHKHESAENKMEFLLKRFGGVKLDKGNKDWANFKRIKSLRDSIVHPKMGEERIKKFSAKDAELTWDTLISYLKLLLKKIYKTKVTF